MHRQLINVRGLAVSCQAYENEPLFGPNHMAEMAKAAVLGGAIAIRANSPDDISAIKRAVGVPVIGLHKRRIGDNPVYITPTLEDALAVHAAGADIVAIDGTGRHRPDGLTLADVVHELRQRDVYIMADVSTVEEGIIAASLGVSYVSTTLSGYTPYSPQTTNPDIALVERLAKEIAVPVVAEGKYCTVSEMIKALDLGAQFVVVGSAITRPQLITEGYIKAIRNSEILTQGGRQ